MQCVICKRGPAWGIRLQAIGGDAMSCNDDLPEAVNRTVRVVGVQGIAWPFRQYIRRELRAVAC